MRVYRVIIEDKRGYEDIVHVQARNEREAEQKASNAHNVARVVRVKH